MAKKITRYLAVMMAIFLILTLSACSGSSSEESSEAPKESAELTKFAKELDSQYAESVIWRLSSYGSDETMGFRLAGSTAEKLAADYLKSEMLTIGLQNVTQDKVTVDSFNFAGANLSFKNADGKSQRIDLGAYQTTLQADDMATEIVYAGKGTESEYEGLNVKGKLVLIDIDQDNEWWINYPAYQAKLKGAIGVVAASILAEENPYRVTSQDVCGPADAPALAISQRDSKTIQSAIKAGNGKSLPVTFNSDAVVKEDDSTINVWGEIPGASEETVLIDAHYDGYYHSQYDDACGVAQVLMMAKAMVDSGYQPSKTLRFILHGAEEWGVTDAEADWSTGALRQITEKHPEWAKEIFAFVGMDSGYPTGDLKMYGIDSSAELTAAVKEVADPIIAGSDYEFSYSTKPSTGREEFPYTKAGVPVIALGEHVDEENNTYFARDYHSNTDTTVDLTYNKEAFNFQVKLFGGIVMGLDQTAVRPMDFGARFAEFAKSIESDYIDDADLTKLIADNQKAGEALQEKIAQMNESGSADAETFNAQLADAFADIQDAFLAADTSAHVTYPHENAVANLGYYDDAIKLLEEGKAEDAYDTLTSIDYVWYATAFDKKTTDYFNKRLVAEVTKGDTWYNNLLRNVLGGFNAPDAVLRSLGEKMDAGTTDYAKETTKLKKHRQVQADKLDKQITQEKKDLAKTLETLTNLAG
jgi:hypothetical protein